MQRIYYNKRTNHVIHVGIQYTLEQIKSRYGDDEYAMLDIDVTTEGFIYKNGELVKVDLIKERADWITANERSLKISVEMRRIAEESLIEKGEL